jgi:tetratricopeptide (TPR) repeat protein
MFLPRLFQSPSSVLNLEGIDDPIRDEAGLGPFTARLGLCLPPFERQELEERVSRLRMPPQGPAASEELALLAMVLHNLRYFRGRHLEAARDLGLAQRAAEGASPVCRGFVRMMMGRFLLSIGMEWTAGLLFEDLHLRSPHPVLELVAEWDLQRLRLLHPGAPDPDELDVFKERFREAGTPQFIAGVDLVLARYRMKRGRIDEAERALLGCLEEARKLKGPRQEVNVLIQLADLRAYGQQRPEDGLDCLDRALGLSRNKFMGAQILQRRVALLRSQGRSTEATQAAREALRLVDEADLLYLLPLVASGLAQLLEAQGAVDEADALHARAHAAGMVLLKAGFDAAALGIGPAVEAYVEHLRQRSSKPATAAIEFPFAYRRSLAELREMFLAAFLQRVLDEPGTLTEKARRLEISRQSLLTYRQRFSNLPQNTVPKELAAFVERHRQLRWHHYRRLADTSVCRYLLGRHRGQRDRLAADLGISLSLLNQLLRKGALSRWEGPR